ANGIVHVSATDKGTGKEQKITITGSSGLDDNEIKRMVNESKEHEEDDKQAKENAEAKNQADTMVYQTEKTLKEHGDKLAEDDRKEIEAALEDVKKLMGAEDVEAIKAAVEKLQTASHKLAEEVYKKTAESGAAPGGSPGPEGEAGQQSAGAKDDVVDAEFVDVDQEKK
ncbi:Chaperone protein DnaK, partial [hydrothermal vent metagenome]